MILTQEQLTERQRLAWEWALGTEKNLLISGFAGTGKTALVQKIRADLEERGRKVCTTAFTGIAAQKIEGITVSRLLGLGLAKSVKFTGNVNWDGAHRNLEGVTDLILDEVSMCSGDFLELVDYALQRVRGVGRSFGGIRMIFAGDFLQLPPVRTPSDPEPHWKWAFQYPEFRHCHGIFLNESMRQKDPTEVRLLNEFRRGTISEGGQRFLEAAVDRPLSNPAELHGRREAATRINEAKLAALEGSSRCFTTLFDPSSKKEWFLTQVPINEDIKLKVGAPVILLANDPRDQYANGSQGIIERLRFDHVEVRMSNGKLVSIEYKQWSIGSPIGHRYGTVEGLPLQLGWATTIHRAQGLTLNEVRADIASVWEPGQAYVALSRTTSLDQLSLVQPVHKIKVCPEVLEFTDQLEVNTS